MGVGDGTLVAVGVDVEEAWVETIPFEEVQAESPERSERIIANRIA
jgi:hypothetical protein